MLEDAGPYADVRALVSMGRVGNLTRSRYVVGRCEMGPRLHWCLAGTDAESDTIAL